MLGMRTVKAVPTTITIVNKPGGVEIAADETTLAARGGAWSDRDVADYEAAHRDRRTSGDTAVTHLLFVDGHSAHDNGNERVLGAGYTFGTVRGGGVVVLAGLAVFFRGKANDLSSGDTVVDDLLVSRPE